MTTRKKRMSDTDLASIIDEQVHASIDWYNTDAAHSRARALAYFEGDETLHGDVPLQPGRSKVVSRDMSDVHGWIMPALLRTFLSSDRVVVYEARRQDAEPGAKQATDYVNYVVLTECAGYSVLHSALWDGLSFGNGLVKHWWDDTPGYETESLSGLPEAEYIRIVSDPAVEEVLEHTEYDGPNYDALADAGGMAGALAPPAGGPAPAPAGALGAYDAGAPGAGGMAPPSRGATPPGAGGALGAPAGAGAGVGINRVDGIVPFSGLAAPRLHDLKIKRKLYNGCLKVVAVPPEEFRIDKAATKLDEDHVRFCAHVDRTRTRSSLIIDYPDKRDIIDELPASTEANTDGAEPIERNQGSGSGDTAPDSSTDLIEVWECYVQLDYDGDGVAEWRRVVTAAGTTERQFLLNEEWGDMLPFSDLVPDPMPHRWRGGSLYEEVGDLQRIKTVLLRGIYDNMYWVNNPLRTALEGQVTPAGMDVLQEPKFGDLVVTRSPGAIEELPTPFIADKLMAGLELADKVREFRTGVSAATMSLDPEALQNQTATAVNAQQTASYTKQEAYARNIAENGMKRLFKCILKLIVKHEDQPRTIRLRGNWEKMDPRGWDADMDVTVNVGLGSGSRDRDLTMLQAVAAKQELVVQGLGPVVAAKLGIGPDVVFATYRKMVEAAGLKSPETYFPEITRQDVGQLIQSMGQMGQQADPHAAAQAAEIQAKIPLMQAEAQARVQETQARIQLLQAQAASLGMKSQGDTAKTQSDVQRGMLGLEHDRAQIENLRASAMANMAKAGAVQSDAEINQQLARLEELDHLVGWHHEQQRIVNDKETQKMRNKVRTPGVQA